MGIRNLIRRLILWAVPEAGGAVRPFQENQDTVPVNLESDTIYDAPKLVVKKYGYWRPVTQQWIEDQETMRTVWDKILNDHKRLR